MRRSTDEAMRRAREWLHREATVEPYDGHAERLAALIDAAERRGRENAERQLIESDESLTETIERRDELEGQIESIHDCTGCEREWTNLHDLGECAILWANSAESTIEELRQRADRVPVLESTIADLRTQLAEAGRQSAAQAQRIVDAERRGYERGMRCAADIATRAVASSSLTAEIRVGERIARRIVATLDSGRDDTKGSSR